MILQRLSLAVIFVSIITSNAFGAWNPPAGQVSQYLQYAKTTTLNNYVKKTTTGNYVTAYNDRLKWDGGASSLVAATGRTSLGLGSIAIRNQVDFVTTGNQVSTLTSYVTKASTGNYVTAYNDRLKWDGGSTGLNATTAKTSLGLTIGSDVQAYDQELAALASVTSAANKVPYFTGSGAASVTDLTATGRALISQSSSSNVRTSLDLGNVENTALSTWEGSYYLEQLGSTVNVQKRMVIGNWTGGINLDADKRRALYLLRDTNSVAELNGIGLYANHTSVTLNNNVIDFTVTRNVGTKNGEQIGMIRFNGTSPSKNVNTQGYIIFYQDGNGLPGAGFNNQSGAILLHTATEGLSSSQSPSMYISKKGVSISDSLSVTYSTAKSSISDSAVFQVISTKKASHPFPSMTEAQRDALTGSTAGDFVFNTDTNHPNYWNGSAWIQL